MAGMSCHMGAVLTAEDDRLNRAALSLHVTERDVLTVCSHDNIRRE